MPPFRGQTQHEIVTALLQQDYHLPGTSPAARALDGVVHRSLAKDPRDRYGSATELANDLLPALARCEPLEARQDLTSHDDSTRGGFTV